jgi:CRP-like cAMP-binding protein
LIETGRLSVYLDLKNSERIRLQTLSMRTMVGELGLYKGFQRTASIIADEPCTVYRLSRNAVSEITEKDAELAAAIHAYIAGLLARRLADTTRLLAALSR